MTGRGAAPWVAAIAIGALTSPAAADCSNPPLDSFSGPGWDDPGRRR